MTMMFGLPLAITDAEISIMMALKKKAPIRTISHLPFLLSCCGTLQLTEYRADNKSENHAAEKSCNHFGVVVAVLVLPNLDALQSKARQTIASAAGKAAVTNMSGVVSDNNARGLAAAELITLPIEVMKWRPVCSEPPVSVIPSSSPHRKVTSSLIPDW